MAKKHVIVIGAGCTGCATAHDLTLRGFDVTVIERGEIASATTGRCSCFLHSGARYSVKDPESAIEAIHENKILRKIMPPLTMEENDGIFILVRGDDQSYGDAFFDGCAKCGIPAKEITPQELFLHEPNVNRDITRVGIIPDAVVEALRFTLSFAATAQIHGAKFMTYTEVEDMLMEGNRVVGVAVKNKITNQSLKIKGDMVVNATGPWANKLASMAGIHIPLSLSPGIHVNLGVRVSNYLLNRMRMPGSGDFITPQRNTSMLGTSSWTVQDCDYIPIPLDHIDQIRESCAALVPMVMKIPVQSVNAAARPLIASKGGSERELSRTFECFDHPQRDNVEGFVTISGGKMITARLMAEKITDIVCKHLNVDVPCQTETYPLVSFRRYYIDHAHN